MRPNRSTRRESRRAAIPVIVGVAMVHVWSMRGGATIWPNRDRLAAWSSVYTGSWSSKAAAQCRIMGWLTGSGAMQVARPDRLADERVQPILQRRFIPAHDPLG